MKQTQKLTNITNEAGDYVLRIDQLEGVNHWVVPVIMMVEGVHNGSRGALLYTAEELGKIPGSWNGIPVIIDHPEEGSANATPELTKQVVGRVFNTQMDGLKLRAEAWININRIQNISEEAYNYIKDHRALDVSVGVFSEEDDEQGVFNNEEYRAIARHLRPDHLALLPHGQGACSWDDGCGVRTNKTNEKGEKNVNDELKKSSIEELLDQGYVKNGLTENEAGFREIMTNIQQKLDQLDNSVRMHFLEELFDDHFVYRVHNRESGETEFFKRNYVVNADGSVEFESDPVQVRKQVTFETVNKMKRTKTSKTNSMKENKKPCELAKSIIENKANKFTEDDREWLEKM